MGIISQRLVGFEAYADRYTTYYEFTLDDERVLTRGPGKIGSAGDTEAEGKAKAISKMASMVPRVEERIAESDADDDVTNDRLISNKRTARKYFQRAMQEDTLTAYKMLNKAQTYTSFNGWSPAQVKVQLNISDAQWSSIVTRYQFFQANSQTIEDFADLDDPGGDF